MILEKFLQLTQEILESGRIGKGQIQGLSDNKIHAFEQHKGFEFPKAYTEFLSFCGELGAEELTGLDFKFGWDDITRQEISFQAEDEGAIVPVIYRKTIFFSGTGHGVYYYFVSETGNDDPEVYWWRDYDEIQTTSCQFSDFVFLEALKYDLNRQKYSNL